MIEWRLDRAPIELLARPSISTNEPIDSIASMGRAMIKMESVFGEQERQIHS